jgi:hypothetical protein
MKGRDTREPSHPLGDESHPNSYKLRGVIISFLHFRMLTNRLPENSPLSANYNLLLCSLQLSQSRIDLGSSLLETENRHVRLLKYGGTE